LVNSPTRVTRPGMVPLLPLIPSLVTFGTGSLSPSFPGYNDGV